MKPTETLLARLQRVQARGRGQWVASCPTNAHNHGDRSRGLSVKELSDGLVLVHCFAGCPASDVLSAVGLSLSDLFPNKIGTNGKSRARKPRYSANEVLKAMIHEVTVVHLIGNQIEREVLGPVERERLALALRRLNNALEFANGR
jgi:hypothetical protein